jgi:hypothetical protein
MAVDAQENSEAKVEGGLGYVPVTFFGLYSPRGHVLYFDDQPLNQSVHGHDFWQNDCDSDTRRWEITFNLSVRHTNRQIAFETIVGGLQTGHDTAVRIRDLPPCYQSGSRPSTMRVPPTGLTS